MAKVKCEKCGEIFIDGIYKKCPKCGGDMIAIPGNEQASTQSDASAQQEGNSISRRIKCWGIFHTVMGWLSLICVFILFGIGSCEYWDEEFISLAYVAAGSIYFFVIGVVLKGFSEITLKTEIILKEKGISLD